MHVVAGVGAVGRAIIDELVARGLPVRAIARRRVADLPAGVEVVEADLTDPDASGRAMVGASVVYHAVREQRYQRDSPGSSELRVVDDPFGVEVTPHRAAITATTAWFATSRKSAR